MADEETALTEFTLECAVDVKFDASDVSSNLTALESVDLVIEIDEEVGKWEATELMYRYFKEQHELMLKEFPDLAAATVDELEAMLDKKVVS